MPDWWLIELRAFCARPWGGGVRRSNCGRRSNVQLWLSVSRQKSLWICSSRRMSLRLHPDASLLSVQKLLHSSWVAPRFPFCVVFVLLLFVLQSAWQPKTIENGTCGQRCAGPSPLRAVRGFSSSCGTAVAPVKKVRRTWLHLHISGSCAKPSFILHFGPFWI